MVDNWGPKRCATLLYWGRSGASTWILTSRTHWSKVETRCDEKVVCEALMHLLTFNANIEPYGSAVIHRPLLYSPTTCRPHLFLSGCGAWAPHLNSRGSCCACSQGEGPGFSGRFEVGLQAPCSTEDAMFVGHLVSAVLGISAALFREPLRS